MSLDGVLDLTSPLISTPDSLSKYLENIRVNHNLVKPSNLKGFPIYQLWSSGLATIDLKDSNKIVETIKSMNLLLKYCSNLEHF